MKCALMGCMCAQDSRMLVGTFLAFDRHMNVVLADTEEFRKVRTKNKVEGKGVVVEEKELKRTVGFILLRGASLGFRV